MSKSRPWIGKALCLIAAVALGCSAMRFYLRGIKQPLQDSFDFLVIRTASHVWLRGGDPYDWKAVERAAEMEGHSPDAINAELHRSVYPPTTYVMISPLTLVPWGLARIVWMGINLGAVGLQIGAIIALAPRRLSALAVLVLIAVLLELAPIGTGMGLGQVSLLATALVVAALAAAKYDRAVAAGLMMGLATCLKVQIGGVFLIYLLARVRGAGMTALAVIAFVSAIAVGQLGISDLSWASRWLENTRATFAPGGISAASTQNAVRLTMTHIQYPLTILTGSSNLANAIAWTFALVLAWLFIRVVRQRDGEGNGFAIGDLLPLATLAMLMLVPVYRRNYDLVILSLPLSWALFSLKGPLRRYAIVALLLMLPMGPNPYNVERLAAARVSPQFRDSTFWQAIFSPYQAWCAAMLAAWMTWTLVKGASRAKSPPKSSSTPADVVD